MGYVIQNYHRHSQYTNPRVSDCIVSDRAYAERAKEFGHGIISSCQHGWQGYYIETFELAQEFDLKFVMVAEAYWVNDRFEKDRSNCHIILAAKNENGRRAINDILAEANITGFYGQPRLDKELILTLPANDVIVTTACLAFWKYDDVDEFVKSLHQHFKKNFFLEVQAHHVDRQREVNAHILQLRNQYGIQLIAGCDSHYIYPEDGADRELFLASQRNNDKVASEDESGFFMDYPSGDELYQRFAQQGVLSHQEIEEALNNTNVFLEVEEYDSPIFNKNIKLPTLYPDLTQEERDKLYTDMVWNAWDKYKLDIPEDQWPLYETEINKEIDVVIQTHQSDYFLIDQKIVEEGRRRGGVVTPTGRGSGVSFFTNTLLGFSKVNRIAAPVKMYPERFASVERILKAQTLFDLDINVASQKPFEEAQEFVLGKGHSYPMIAFNTQKEKAAWKMYSRAKNVDFEISNRVSEGIEKYNMALKHADDDEKEFIDITKYIPKELAAYYEESKAYQSIITSWQKAPCSYLLYQGDIRKEIGLIRTKEDICTLADGHWVEGYHMEKNDLLRVQVVELIDKVYKKIGCDEIPPIDEMRRICTPDDPVWDVYKKAATLGVNQCEQRGTAGRVAQYAPKNLSELTSFIAAIRPGFVSMYKIYSERQRFEYGVPSFDKLIQTEEMPDSFLLYQEQIMTAMAFAGIPISETYTAIKNIAKKRVDKVLAYKDTFIRGFSEHIQVEEFKSQEEADEIAGRCWQIIEDSSSYMFNASHAYCVAGDSLYTAWLKAHHPLEFYEVLLQLLDADGKKDKMAAAKEEAQKHFNITFPLFRWGQDNRSIVADKATNSITNSLTSIKGMSQSVADGLYEVAQLGLVFIAEIFVNLKEHGVSMAKIAELIKIDYFAELGNIPTVSRIFQLCELLKWGEAKSIKGEKIPAFKDIALKYTKNTNADGEVTDTYTFTNERVEKYKKQATATKRALTKAQKAGEDTEILQGEYDLFCSERDEACRELVMGFLTDCEDFIKAQNLSDLSFAAKAANQLEILGDIDLTTGKEEDRHKLYITDIYPLVAKKTGTVWAYSVKTKSIGRGKLGRWTIKAAKFDIEPVKKGDIIEFDPKTGYYTDRKGDQSYYTLVEYHHVYD